MSYTTETKEEPDTLSLDDQEHIYTTVIHDDAGANEAIAVLRDSVTDAVRTAYDDDAAPVEVTVTCEITLRGDGQ